MNLFFEKITPVSVVCMAAIIYLIVLFFISQTDYSIAAFLLVYIVLLAGAFAIDRFLVSRVDYKKLLVFELVFVAVCAIGYLYAQKRIEIVVETSNPYFFVIYDSNGLKKEAIPSKGLFSRSVTVKGDSVIHVNKLLESAEIKPPESWGNNYTSERKDALIHAEKVVVEIYAGKMEYKKVIQLLQAEVRKLEDK